MRRFSRRFSGSCALMLSILCFPLLHAQSPKLQVTVLSGEGHSNNIKTGESHEISVSIQDDKGQPVAQASVTFELPSQGASGSFTGGAKTQTVMTDAQGKASLSFRPNTASGAVNIRVTASSQGQTVSTTIHQVNLASGSGKGLSTGAKVLIVLGIAGGAAAGGIVATQGGRSSTATPTPIPTPTPTPTPTITLTTGTPTVGGPR